MQIDLHLHSNYSDGYLTPTELAQFIATQKIKIAALTDHHSINGIAEFSNICQKLGIKTITGVEIYCRLDQKSFNILWYNFDNTSQEMRELLHDSQVCRYKLMKATLLKLQEYGFEIKIEKVLSKYKNYIPLNHITGDILSIKHNVELVKKENNLKKVHQNDVIVKYLRNPKIGKLHNHHIELRQILELRKKIGGQLIICHPAKHPHSHIVNKELWENLKQSGIDGAETLSPHHSYSAIIQIQRLAQELNFIETGGSDFHCFENKNHLINSSLQYFKIDSDCLRKIKTVIG